MHRHRPRRVFGSNLVLALAGLLVLVIVLLVLIDQRRIQRQIALTEQDLQTVVVGEPIADRLPGLPGFAQLMTIPIAAYDPQVVDVYRKSVGRKHGTGMQWDICVDQRGRVIAILREGAGHR